MVYQQFINYPSFKVYDNIASPLRIAGLDKAAVDDKVRHTARLLRIDHLLDRLPAELSGGQQQRCAIARALVKEAPLLLLDEPLVNLDYKLREELRAELQGALPLERHHRGVRHDRAAGGSRHRRRGDRPARGPPAAEGPGARGLPPPRLGAGGRGVQRPAHEHDRRGDRRRQGPAAGGFSLPLRESLARLRPGAYRLGLRASHLSTRRRHAGDLAFDATVELAEVNGSETFLHVVHSGVAWVVQEEGVHLHPLGGTVRVFLDPAHLFVFSERGALEVAPANRGTVREAAHGTH